MVGVHRLAPESLLDTTHLDTRIILILHTILDSEGGDIAGGRAREANGHSIVTLLIALGRDGSEVLGAEGDIILAICTGLVVLIRIDTEDREVSRMAWPHPVVRVSTKLTDRSRRSEDETHVVEDIVGQQIVLIIGVVGAYLDALVVALVLLHLGDLYLLADLLYLGETV